MRPMKTVGASSVSQFVGPYTLSTFKYYWTFPVHNGKKLIEHLNFGNSLLAEKKNESKTVTI